MTKNHEMLHKLIKKVRTFAKDLKCEVNLFTEDKEAKIITEYYTSENIKFSNILQELKNENSAEPDLPPPDLSVATKTSQVAPNAQIQEVDHKPAGPSNNSQSQIVPVQNEEDALLNTVVMKSVASAKVTT